MSDVVDTNARLRAPRIKIYGDPSFIELAPNAAAPAPDVAARVYADSAGEFSIVAPNGSTITLAPASLTGVRVFSFPDYNGQLATISGAESFTNKTITSTTNIVHASHLRTTGTSVNVAGSAPPSTGYVLTAVNASSANWQAPSGGNSRTTYVLQSMQAVASTTWVAVGYFPWVNARHSTYTNGVICYYVTIGGPGLNIRLRDTTNDVVLGQELAVAATGARSFAVINPLSNSIVAIEIQKQSESQPSPFINGITLEFN